MQTPRLWNVCFKLGFVVFMLAGILSLNGGRVLAASNPGSITEYTIPSTNSFPGDITVGFDDDPSFTESETSKIARITSSGQITEFPTPTPGSSPQGITRGPDGALWFVETSANQIGRKIGR